MEADWIWQEQLLQQQQEAMQMAGFILSDKPRGEYKVTPAGVHSAVVDQIIDLGKQPSMNPAYKATEQLYIRWQIPAERISYEKDGVTVDGPMTISKQFTKSLNEKSNLRKFLEAFRGRPFTKEELAKFDISKIVGAPCQLLVAHETKGEKTRATISAVMPLTKGTPAPKVEGQTLLYSPAAHDQSAHDRLPNWLKEKISQRIDDTPAPVAREPGSDGDKGDEEVPF
jgi:hypothetical protein